jgi:hypothetical protein
MQKRVLARQRGHEMPPARACAEVAQTGIREPADISVQAADAKMARRGHQSASLMPIYRLLQNVPIGSEEISRLATAYERTLRTIGIVDRGDALAELVARKVIEVAQTGIREPADISARAIKEIADAI